MVKNSVDEYKSCKATYLLGFNRIMYATLSLYHRNIAMNSTGDSAMATSFQNEVGGTAMGIDQALALTVAFKGRENQVKGSAVFAFSPSPSSIAICFRQATNYLEIHIESPKRPLCRECEVSAARIKAALKKSKHKPQKLIAKLTENDDTETGVEGNEWTFGERLKNNLTAYSVSSSIITATAAFFISRQYARSEINPTGVAFASVCLLAGFVLLKTVLEVWWSGDRFSWKFEN
jgi:hypothetical protein